MAIKFGRPIEPRARLAPMEQAGIANNPAALDLATRMRRNRRTDWARRLVRERVVTTDDLIWPLFVADVQGRTAVASMPCVDRLSLEDAVRESEHDVALSMPV